jgi:hypothetical protein
MLCEKAQEFGKGGRLATLFRLVDSVRGEPFVKLKMNEYKVCFAKRHLNLKK